MQALGRFQSQLRVAVEVDQGDAGGSVLQRWRELGTFVGGDVVAELAGEVGARDFERSRRRRIDHGLVDADAEDGLIGPVGRG